jgi:hypothetical protein
MADEARLRTPAVRERPPGAVAGPPLHLIDSSGREHQLAADAPDALGSANRPEVHASS